MNKGNFYNSILNELDSQAHMAISALCEASNYFEKYSLAQRITNEKSLDKISSEDIKLATHNAREMFRNIHSFISCHANISKLLNWKGGSREHKFPGSRSEKKTLITKLKQLKENLSSLNCRKLRDHLEHYGERIIFYSYNSNVSSFAIKHSSKREERANNMEEKDYMRLFLYDVKKYIFRGEEFDISKMESDIYTLIERIKSDSYYLGID